MAETPMNISDLKADLEEALRYTYDRDDEWAKRVASAIAVVYKDSSASEWQRVATRFQTAFGFSEDEVVERLGVVPTSSSVAATSKATRAPFETLVPDGWFRRYLEWTSDHESPAQYHFGSAIAAIAAGFGRAPLLEWEARRTYANLYVLLVGPSGARKGSAMERAVGLVQSAMATKVLPTEGTAPGFAAALKKRYKETGLASDGLIMSPEFNVLITDSSTKENLVQWLTDWYDSPDHWERALRGEAEYVLQNVCLSILGGSNMEWLKRMPEDAITGGFLPRFVIFDADDKRFWRARPRFSKALERELYMGLETLAERVPEKIGFQEESAAYLDDWYENELRAQYEATSDERFRKWISRKQAAVMKLAIVWQLADGGPTDGIRVKWLRQARAVVDWGDVSVAQVYAALGVTRLGAVNEEVHRFIESRQGRVSNKAILREMRRQYSKSQVEEALKTLEAAGVVKQVRSVLEGVVWQLCSGK